MADSDLNDLIRRIAYYLDDQLVDEPEKIARELIAAGYRRPSPLVREGDVVIPRDRLVALVEWAEQQASHAFRVKDGEKVGNAFVEMSDKLADLEAEFAAIAALSQPSAEDDHVD